MITFNKRGYYEGESIKDYLTGIWWDALPNCDIQELFLTSTRSARGSRKCYLLEFNFF